MAQNYTIREFDSFTCGKDVPGYISLPEKTFFQLEQFILANKSCNSEDALELMSITSRHGVGKLISAKNYVGVICMNDGTEIEILPKIYSSEVSNQEETKRIFLNMLRTIKDIPYKTFNISKLKTEHINIFEVFIRMFIDEANAIIKKGLKSSYFTVSGNETFFKGKLQFSQHIKNNYIHKERAYVEYDVFSFNRPENKLVKSTTEYLMQHTASAESRKKLTNIMYAFDGVEKSNNYVSDFSRCVSDRTMSGYDTVLKWCRVFLMNKSFTAFKGSDVAFALLFPMEQVFESYVAYKLKRALAGEYQVKVQDKGLYLFDYPSKKFSLRPDIVVKNNRDGSIAILDTKWKLLSQSYHNYGISQSDMYQMYAYQKKYEADQMILVYPLNEKVAGIKEDIMYKSSDGVVVKVFFIDLVNMKESIEKLRLAVEGA